MGWWLAGALLILVGVLMPGLMPGRAAAAAVPDASCPGPGDSSPVMVLGDRREAQTFVAIHSGALQRVTIDVTNSDAAGPPYLLQILPTSGGVPVDNPLASVNIPSGTTGAVTLGVTFIQGPFVQAGDTYAIAISRPTANFVVPTWGIQAKNPGECGGATYYSLGASFNWSQEFPVSFVFQTFVDPVQLKPGAGGTALNWSLVSKHGRLFARIPAPGTLIVDDPKKPAKKGSAQTARKHNRGNKGSLNRTKTRARKAGDIPLRVQLTQKAIAKALRTRKLNLVGAVTYRPRSGGTDTIRFRIHAKL